MQENTPAKCKRCGKTAPANTFIIDPEYKQAVCAGCAKERQNKQAHNKEERRTSIQNTPLRKPLQYKETKKTGKRCPGCKYTFEAKSKDYSRCPFCKTPL